MSYGDGLDRRPPPLTRGPGAPFELGDLLTQPREWCESAIRERCHSATLGDGAALCRVLGRYRMFVDTADVGDSAALLLDGFRELPVVAAMLGSVRRGATVVDVGARLGYQTLLLADLVGPAGNVIAVEPNPSLAKRARDSIAVNGFTGRAMLHECALGASDGETVRRLDAFPEAVAAEFVRIDAPGEEQRIWRGMTGLLARGGSLTVILALYPERLADPAGFLSEIAGEGFSVETVPESAGRVLLLRR